MLLIDEVAALIEDALQRCPASASTADRARFLSLSIAEHFAGQQVYWALREVRDACDQARAQNGRFSFSPHVPSVDQAERDARIERDFGAGVSANDIARAHRISVQTVYAILRRRADQAAADRRQLDLFAPAA